MVIKYTLGINSSNYKRRHSWIMNSKFFCFIIFLILFLILWIFNPHDVWAGNLTVDILTDSSTGITTFSQMSVSNHNWEWKLTELPLTRKSYLDVKLSAQGVVSPENWMENIARAVFKNDSKVSGYPSYTLRGVSAHSGGIRYAYWYGDVDPSKYSYYIITDIDTVSHEIIGSSMAKATVIIKPYFKLKYEESGGDGAVKIHKNGIYESLLTTNKTIEVIAGERVSLVATPAYGYRFVRWEGVVEGSNPISTSFIMNGDKTVTAVYEELDLTVDKVSLPSEPITPVIGGVSFSWEEIDDDVSGIAKYQVLVTQSTSTPSDHHPDIKDVSESQYTFMNLSSKNTYYAWVRAIDGAENEGDWVHTSGFTPKPERTSLKAEDGHMISGNGISYQVNLTIDRVDARYYEIHRTIEGQNNWKSIKIIEDAKLSTTTSISNIKTTSFVYTDTTVQKHKSYQYKVITKDKNNRQPVESFDVKVEISNIPASYSISPVGGIKSHLNSFTFAIDPTVDTENDQLKFQVWYKKAGQADSDAKPNKEGFTSGSVTIDTFTSGIWEWWLKVREYNGTSVISETTTPHRTLYIDQTLPFGELTVKGLDNGQTLSELIPTNSRDVEIEISNITDSKSYYISEVKNIYIWDNKEISGETISYDEYLSGQTSFPWRLTTGDGIKTINLKVTDHAGNEYITSRKVLYDTTAPDAPGSFGHTPIQYVPNNSIDTITFNWSVDNSSNDVEGFAGTYRLNGGADRPIVMIPTSSDGTLLKGSVDIDVSSLLANQEVEITIYAYDKAGNKSSTASYSAYTKAAIGAVEVVDGGYDQTTQSHFIQWRLTDSGDAKEHVLEYGNLTNDKFTIKGTLELIDDHFTLTECTRHEKVYYRLVALNESDDRTCETDPYWEIVPNDLPTAPVLTFPTNYSNGNPQFKFDQCSDEDGEVLNYYLYFAAGKNPDDSDFAQTGPFVWGGTIQKLDLPHGQVYTWYIEVDDQHGGVQQSSHENFTVDTNEPVLEVEAPNRLYTNQLQLKVTTSDVDSGIKDQKVEYKRIDCSTNDVTFTGNASLSTDENGELTGQIPLTSGEYHLQVFVYDLANNPKQIDYQNLKVDHKAPVLSNLSIDLDQDVSGRYVTGFDSIPMSITANDQFAKNGILRYWFVTNQGDESGDGDTLTLSPRLTDYAYTLDLSGDNNQEYYLVVKVEDRAGNLSEPAYIGPIYIDRTVPQVNLAVTGFVSHGGSYYVSNLDQLMVKGTAIDLESTAVLQFNILNVDTDTYVTAWGDWAVVKNTALIAGERYKLVAQGINGVGLTTTNQSLEFIFDDSKPQISSFSGPTTDLVSGEVAIFTMSASDSDSSLVEYQLALGSTPDGTELTARIPGNQNGWVIIEPSATEYRVEIPQVDDGTYYPKIRVMNGAGLTNELTGSSFTVDNIQEKVVVGDQGPYIMATTYLTGWWNYVGEKQVSSYQYRVIKANGDSVTDWKTTTDTMIIVTDLSLVSGQQYQFEVKALDSSGNEIAQGTSLGVTVDATEPEITEFIVHEFATSWNLEIQWNGDDLESDITQVLVAIGNDYYGTDVTDGWVPISDNRIIDTTVESSTNPITCDAKGNLLNLQTGKSYYITLRLVNGAGRQREITAPPVIIDNTAPPLPEVWDQGNYINTIQPLKAHWTSTPVDEESGTVSYQWALLEHGESIDQAVWYDPTEELKVALDEAPAYADFTQIHGTTYYFAVKAINGAGLTSIAKSDGIMVDQTAPYIPELMVLNALDMGDNSEEFEELNYINSLENLVLWIESTEPDSAIAKYFYAWGVRENVDNQTREESNIGEVALSTPPLIEGDITVFAGECINVVDELSATGYSTGVMLDLGAPTIKDVNGTVSDGKLLFDWGVDPSNSPVAGYEVTLLTEKTIDTIPDADDWTSTDLSRNYMVDGSNLPDGYYYLLVKAFNSAGTYSRRNQEVDQWGLSPCITLDRTKPWIKSLTYDAFASTEIQVDVTADDNLSGIQGYQYALGTLTNPTQFSGGWIDLDAQPGVEGFAFPVDISTVPDRTIVYLQVRAQDGVGLWSDAEESQQILIDKTAPEVPVITTNLYTNVTTQLSNITYTSIDLESGVTHYLLSVVTEIGGTWLTTPEAKPVDQFTGQLTGLQLPEGDYYLVMKTKNGAGLWSDLGYSEAIKVDTTDPTLIFANPDSELVFNETITDVPFTLSEDATVEFTLTSKTYGSSQQYTFNGVEGVNHFDCEQSTPDTYILKARPTDPAGNMADNDIEREIRINHPPTISFNSNSFETTPGQLTQYTATVSDSDGRVVKYEWDFGDNTTHLFEESPKYIYSEVKQYILTLTVTDNDMKETSKSIPVNVNNTTSGKLYASETWSGTHQIKGDIVVPKEFSLTILPGTIITVQENAVTGYQHGLVAQGNLKIQGSDGQVVSFVSVEGRNGLWNGIYIEGEASLEYVKIEHAIRGITTLDKATVSVSNSILQNNNVGVHVLGGTTTIENTVIRDHLWYGIKEDRAGRPVMIDCIFSNNQMDYYRYDLLKITLDQLNTIEGNSGNTH